MTWPRALAWLAIAATQPVPSRAAERFEMQFGEHLGLADLRLSGARATRQVEFPWPLDWRGQAGALLRLRFEHSAALDSERSFLAVSLNHGVLRSLRLEPQNAAPTELLVPLPVEMLREDNQLVISVEQFSTTGAVEDAWTVVSAESSVAIPFERRRVEWSLVDLPEPILRRRSYEPGRLTVVLPSRPSDATLEATARTIAALASRVAPASVALAFARSVGDLETPSLVVGTAREQPALRELGDLGADATDAAATVGVVALLPEVGSHSQPVLVVTGRQPSAVSKAALALFGAPRRKGSRLLLVDDAPAPRLAAPREWRRCIPPSNGFTIHEAGDQRPELAVTSDLPARVRLEAPPDARFLPYGHRATLVFEALPALASDSKANLEVYWNDVLLRQASMEHTTVGRTFALSAPIPASALKGHNLLTVAWNGRSGATGPFVSLRGESTLFLPREYVAELPDLAMLRFGFYPFSLRADLSDTVIGVPRNEEALPALFELSGLLGRLAPSQQFLFRVAPLAEAAANHQGNAILLETAEEPSGITAPDVKRLPRGELLERLPLLQELESPRVDGRYVLRLRAPTPALLRAAARGLGARGVLERLSGDAAFLASEGPLGFRVSAQRRIAEISYITRLEAWLRAYWLALPLILVAISGLLFMGLRVVLGYQRDRT
ncbi:MAG TPA: cellulose biosynthesis cyclic di-GMP-binding regulatory protein BcsB [Vicinamibacteria bacterium]|nr:cellulose biosynthesis cyclic di-GMP-binding regulatory protein BcsB [Vicinamibacteria bacterium]